MAIKNALISQEEQSSIYEKFGINIKEKEKTKKESDEQER